MLAFHFVASVTCLELFPIAHFLRLVVGTSQMAPRGCGNALCAETLERRRVLCLAGEHLAQGELVTVSHGGRSLPSAAATAVTCGL